MALCEMRVETIIVDPFSKNPIVILRTVDGAEEPQILPIWVGSNEANAIAMGLENISLPRPLTHDLMKSLLDHLDARVERVIINSLEDSTYYALIELQVRGERMQVDARPSDAIALALRAKSSIFVEGSVLDQSREYRLSEKEGESEEERLRRWLETLRPEDFGEYKM